MKLLHYTYLRLFIWLLLLVTCWGVFFYFTLTNEITDETDDALENYRDLIVGKVLKNPLLINTEGDLTEIYLFRPLSVREAENYQEIFYDSLLYIESEDEYEPVRVMKSSFRMPDDSFYELELRISVLERDDMVKAVWSYLGVLFILLFVCLIVGMHRILRKSFVPLQKLLFWLEKVKLGRAVPPLDNETGITEYRKLNEAAWALSLRSEKAYQEQKQFIENASHELQTPLAVLRNKLDLLAQADGITEEWLSVLGQLYQPLNQAVRLNKSLLLLTRINNGQYTDSKEIEVAAMVKKILQELSDLYQDKKLKVFSMLNEDIRINTNETLAYILFSNLIKNAFFHTGIGGRVDIRIEGRNFIIENSGETPLDRHRVFQRFYRPDLRKKNSSGLGLAIVKSVVDFYGFSISYHYQQKHIFRLKLS